MMNITDEEVNQGLAMGSTNYADYSIRTRLLNSSGAGVNADIRNDLAFAAPDPLSELVWSPRNGLTLRCANSSAADKKPFLMWNVEPSNSDPSPSLIIRPKGNQDDNAVDLGNTFMSQTALDADDIFIDMDMLCKPLGSCEDVKSNMKMEEEAGGKDVVQNERNHIDGQMEDCPSQNVQGASIAEINKENADLQPQKEPEETSATGVVNVNKIDVLGFTAENDMCNPTEKDEVPMENFPPGEGSQTESRICLYKEMGKERAVSDGDIYGKSLDDDEGDSYESIESCSSAGLFSRGLKRRSCDESFILGSRKMKKQVHGGPGLTPITKPDSSFLNWISNMAKGFSSFNKEDCTSIPLPVACSNGVHGKNHHENSMCNKGQDSAGPNTGFQALFQSLYCRDTNVLNTGLQKEKDSVEESRELMVDDKKSLEHKQIIMCEREIDCSPHLCGSSLAENKASDSFCKQMDIAAEKPSLEIPLASSDVPGKSILLTNLWITRLCAKNPRPEKCQEMIQETIECSTECPKINLDYQMNVVLPTDQKISETRDDSADSQVHARFNSEALVDLKSKSKLCPIIPSQKFRSEAMASVFARRLDALRHIVPSENDAEDNQKLPLCDTVSAQNTAALSEIFRAIKNLRLSRADILRLMNSNVSLSHLNGFFLRLRLGKLETGLEGTFYSVACITGDARELSGCSSKKSIFVDVGGIKSSVTSQYVSNHDFLEDEVKAWWFRILDSGCRIPSLDELNSKFNDRKSLGL